jgi:hypothetical protein
MSKVMFEMDGDEYCKLMQYKNLGTVSEWEELKLIKDMCPCFVESRQYDNFGNHNKTTRYFSKGELFIEITKLNQELNDDKQKLKNENSSLKDKINNSSFRSRFHYLLTKEL